MTLLERILATPCPEEHGWAKGPCWGGEDEHPYFCASRIAAAEGAAPKPPVAVAPTLLRTCNRHNDCAAADAKAFSGRAIHCNDDCCEDYFDL